MFILLTVNSLETEAVYFLYPLHLRQDSKKQGKFLGKWNLETETDS